MSRSLVPVGLVLLLAVAGTAPAAAQSAPASDDSLAALVELPARPVSVAPAAEAVSEAPQAITMPEVSAPSLTPAAAVFGASAISDTLTVLVEYRAESEISRDLQNAVAEKALAERRADRARMLATQAEARIEIKASEIKSLEAEIDFAKSEKNEARRGELEGHKKFAGIEKQLLERRRELRQREIDMAQAMRAYHEATEKACRLELELAVNRRERAAIKSTVDPDAAAEFRRLQAEIVKIEGRVLDAQVERAGKLKSLAQKEEQLGKIRRAVYESQMKVAKSGR
jgi:predicted  nucleic acid-binding Zn-ribbon protein